MAQRVKGCEVFFHNSFLPQLSFWNASWNSSDSSVLGGPALHEHAYQVTN
jgi:hypothetical protein